MPLKKLQISPGSRVVFLPIKPQYINLILSGVKTVEYRRRPPQQPVSVVVLYSSSPVKRVVGLAEVIEVSCGRKEAIWTSTSKNGGITHKEYSDYFSGNEMSCVLKLGRIVKLTYPLEPSAIKRNFKVPQSYTYVDAGFIRRIYEKGF